MPRLSRANVSWSRPYPPRSSSTGFSMLEVLLVLGIAAAIIIAAFVVYPKASNAQKVTAEESNLNSISAGLKSLYAGSSDYSSLGNVSAIQAKVFPEAMVSSSNAVTNTWGGDVSVNSGGSLLVGGFQIDYAGVPSESCVKLVAGVASSFMKIYVNSTTVKNAASSVNLDVAMLATACQNTTNSITFLER